MHHGHMILSHKHCDICDAWLCEGVIYHIHLGSSRLLKEVTAIATMLERLGFTREAAGDMTRACNVDSLDEVKWMDGEDDVENMIKRVNRPGYTNTIGTVTEAVTSLRAENNLKLCAYYL
jgi:hypothetical protein